MIDFELANYVEVNEKFQGFTWREFFYSSNKELDDNSLIMTFVRSDYSIKQTTKAAKYDLQQERTLRQAFDFKHVRANDFKKLTKSEVADALTDFCNDPDWGEDRHEFTTLLDKYLVLQIQLADDAYYMLSKDWYEKDDKRILSPEDWIYLYYFVIIHIDRASNTLIFTEWCYD